MKIFIDILTPKQGMLFSKLSDRLREHGHQVFEATRDYREVTQLLQMKRVNAKIIGKHGGETLQGKLEASVDRMRDLTSFLSDLRPDVVVSFSSPETSRVAFGLGFPHVCVNDSPHAESVARLTIPLATVLLTPKIIPKTAWTKFGISGDSIVQYNALDAWAWLRGFTPDEKVLSMLGLEKSKPIVALRTEESFAAYLLGKTSKTPVIVPLIERLLKSNSDLQAVAIPRYESQVALLKERFGNRIAVCESVIDGPSLLSYTSVFVGAGGTMSAEAALLGVPVFSCYPDEPYLIEKYLIRKRLIVRETDPEKLRVRVLNTIRKLEAARRTQTEKARKLTSSFEDPIAAIARAIQNIT